MSNKHLLVRKPESGSLSQQKKQNQSPTKRIDRFFRKPTTTTNLPFYPRSPMKVVKNQSMITIQEKEKKYNKSNSQENIQNKSNDNLNNRQNKQAYLRNKDQNRNIQEDVSIFAFLKNQQEEQQKQSYLQQSLSSGNTSEQYSVINEEDEFLTSFNQRFMNKEKDQNIEGVTKEKQQNKCKQSQSQKVAKQQQGSQQSHSKKSQSKDNVQLKKSIKESEQLKENDKAQKDRKSVQKQKVNQTNEQTNEHIFKQSFPKYSDLSLIGQQKQHIYQSLSYQVSVSAQSHQQSEQVELSYSNSNNELSSMKVSLSSKLMKIPQYPSSEEQSIMLPPNNEFNQQQQQQQKQQQKSKVENLLIQGQSQQNTNNIILNSQLCHQKQSLQTSKKQSQDKLQLLLEHKKIQQKQIDSININADPGTNKIILDSFGMGLSQQQSKNSNTNSLFLQQSKQERKMQISQVKDYVIQQQRIIEQSVSFQSHYNRDKYYSYYIGQDQQQNLQQLSQQIHNDSQIQTSQSTYTITQSQDHSVYQQQQQQQEQEQGNQNNNEYYQQPEQKIQKQRHSNFLYHFSNNRGYVSSSQSQNPKQLSQSNFRQNLCQSNFRQNEGKNINNTSIIYKINNKKVNIKKEQYESSKSIKSKHFAVNVNKRQDQFYNLHMNKLDGLIVQILKMKKDFQLHYIDTIRAQAEQSQNNNVIIMKQLRDIQNKLNINNNQQRSSDKKHKRSNSRAKQLIKQKEQKYNKRQVQEKDQSYPQIDYQEDYNYLQTSIVNVIKQQTSNHYHQNYHKQKYNTFQNTFINQNLNRNQHQNHHQNLYGKQNIQDQSINQVILPSPKNNNKSQKQNQMLKKQNKKSNKFKQLKAPLKFTLKPKRIRKNLNNHHWQLQCRQQGQYQNQAHRQLWQIINRQKQEEFKQNKNEINQSQQQYGWQGRKGSTLSDKTSVYSSNQQIDIIKDQGCNVLSSLSQRCKMLNSLSYVSKVVSNKKQLKNAIKKVKKFHKSLMESEINQQIKRQEQLDEEQNNDSMKVRQNIDSNITINISSHNNHSHSQSSQKSNTQVQQQQQAQNGDEHKGNKCVQTVPFDDYQVYKQCENTQVHYLTDGFLTEFERQTIDLHYDNKEHQAQQVLNLPQSLHRSKQIIPKLIHENINIGIQNLINNDGIEQLQNSNYTKQRKQTEQSKQVSILKQSKCLITRPQTINNQSLNSHSMQNSKQLSSNQLQTNKQQLTNYSLCQQQLALINNKKINLNLKQQLQPVNQLFTHPYVKQPAIQYSKQPITHISFNKKLKQGKYTRGQTKQILYTKQQIYSKNLQNQIKPNQQNYQQKYSRLTDESNNQQQQKFNFNNDSSIQILTDSPIFDSIYYQRHQKQLYKYKWFKFK